MTPAMVLQARKCTNHVGMDIGLPSRFGLLGERELSKTGSRQQLLRKVNNGETRLSRRFAAPFWL